jgi:diguanylate cyclase (GGDEF)-like protein
VPRVTASIGVAFFPQHAPELDEVVNIADAAMYRAKAEGRDRIVLAPAPEG